MNMKREIYQKEGRAFEKTSEELERIAKIIVEAAFEVHRQLGPGLLEKIYEACFCYELTKRGLECRRQVEIPFFYDGLEFDEGLRVDVLVEEAVICELKAVETVNPLWQAQIISHLKLTNRRLGFLINFNVPLIKQGIKRFIR